MRRIARIASGGHKTILHGPIEAFIAGEGPPEIAELNSMKARQPGRLSDQSSKPPVRGVLDSGNPSSQRKRTPKNDLELGP